MSKYLEFKEVPFKGKTKRFDIVSKTSFEECPKCLENYYATSNWCIGNKYFKGCSDCFGTGKSPLILGRISWYAQWRQYIFKPSGGTVWNKDCLKTVQDFLQQLMDDRKL